MSLGLVGRKVGMTRVFAEDGASIPVTVLDMAANRVTQIKTLEADGYSAVQITFGTKKASRVNKAEAGHFAKAGVEAGLALVEFRIPAEKAAELKAGDALSVELFSVGQMVDVTGTSQGKGWAGVIKRYHFASNRATHGNSLSHRSAGSIGQAQDPGRVLPGKRMAGQLGNVQRTVQNLEIVRVDAERQLLLVKGGVPGSKGNDVIVRSSVKAGA
nr:50S ribosomal protein L3 [uncultured Deefgea sp.]